MNKKRYTKKWEGKINSSWNVQLDKEPLLAFSFVLSTRHNQLTFIADEILDNLDKGISNERIDTNIQQKQEL